VCLDVAPPATAVTSTNDTTNVFCHTGIPTKGSTMWWLYIAILLGVFLAIVVALKRRGAAGKSGDAPYSAETSAAQAARQMDRGGMGGA